VYLRAVSAAARIGASLEPFAGEKIVAWRDGEERLHFDQECGVLKEPRQVVVELGEVYLYRQCGTCVRPYRFNERVERYGEAVELLQRAKILLKDGEGERGLQAMRSRQQAAAACRRAVTTVVETGSEPDVLRCAKTIRRQIEPGEPRDVEGYLDWAASMVIDERGFFPNLQKQDPERWRARIEYARGELRLGNWDRFEAALGVESEDAQPYKTAVGAIREQVGEVLIGLEDGEEEGDLLLWVAGRCGVEKAGTWYALVPTWTLEVAQGLGARFVAVGEASGAGIELVEMYAELARSRAGGETLQAAKRLVRARAGK
jgi:hypothetical protein